MKIQVLFSLPTSDFKKREQKTLIVTTTDSEIISGDIEYKVTIPDYIFEKLADSEPKFKTTYDQNNSGVSGLFSEKTLTRKFMKTQTSVLISALQNYISGLTDHLVDKYNTDFVKTKKIFIKFTHSFNPTTNNWTGSYRGHANSQFFQFFIGYEVIDTTKNENTMFPSLSSRKRYITHIEYHPSGATTSKKDTGFKEIDERALPLQSASQSIQNFEKEFSIIDWTQEREDFCKNVQDTFNNINAKLSSFLSNIDNEKMDNFILNSPFTKLLN